MKFFLFIFLSSIIYNTDGFSAEMSLLDSAVPDISLKKESALMFDQNWEVEQALEQEGVRIYALPSFKPAHILSFCCTVDYKASQRKFNLDIYYYKNPNPILVDLLRKTNIGICLKGQDKMYSSNEGKALEFMNVFYQNGLVPPSVLRHFIDRVDGFEFTESMYIGDFLFLREQSKTKEFISKEMNFLLEYIEQIRNERTREGVFNAIIRADNKRLNAIKPSKIG